MSSTAAGPALLGRRHERAALDRLVAEVRAGQSRVLVLRGEAGVGKSALLEYLVAHAAGCRLARAAGVESERELPFGGLQQLCAPLLDRLPRLPAPQRDALGTAFGVSTGEPPDRFLVGLAVLSLLSDVVDDQPLVCVVDDAQWLDQASAQTLAFVARRLLAERIAVVVAAREDGAEQAMRGLPELLVHGLHDTEALTLLDTALPGPLEVAVRDRIVAETRGNPLALLELPRGLTPAELAFGFTTPEAMPLAGRIEQGFRRRLDPLPADTRQLLLTAAVEPVGDVTLLWRALDRLGIGADSINPAAAAGLVELGARVRFRHPLVRSAVYRAASLKDRQGVHRALAEATDPAADPDRRAWHRAQATPGLDEDVAAELERSAGRAQARGGLAAAAAFRERAAELTPEPGHRARRALAAAQSKHQAGATEAALVLLGMAQAGQLDELQSARAQLLRAQIAFAVTRGRDAPPLLLAAARRLEPLDPTLARDTYLDAFSAALFADRLGRGGEVREIAEAVLAAGRAAAPGPPRARDLLLDGLAVLTVQGYAAAGPTLKRALIAFRTETMSDEDALRWLLLAGRIARGLSDDASWDELTDRHVRLARRVGALSLLPIALTERSGVELLSGNLARATSMVAEAAAVIAATDSDISPHGAVWMATWRGRETQAGTLVDAGRPDVVRRGEGLWLISTDWATANLLNGRGRYEEALAAAQRATEQPYGLGLSNGWVAHELIEAAARSGRVDLATDALARLSEVAQASGTDWALGVEARCRALLSEGDDAERLYREAVERLGRTRIRVALARAHLLYGEWLRRAGRRLDAREQLRTAHLMFTEIGMEAFAERARRELSATGETARKRTVETVDELTAQETQIAHLARDGLSNAEIAAELFISPRTVEWHLRKVFSKLGISSRRQLRGPRPGF